LYETALTDMREIVEFAIDSYKFEIKRNQIEIEFKKPDKSLQTVVDVRKMRIAVQNIIDNAIKYSHTGGKIIISLTGDDKEITLKVQDFGIGIPQTQHDSIFTKFFRSENATKVDPNGTGLGLFLTKNIINAHGGKIWFESKENAGTTIYFSLPINEKEIGKGFNGFLKNK